MWHTGPVYMALQLRMVPQRHSVNHMSSKDFTFSTLRTELHWTVKAKFRSRAQTAIDHRLLLPQSSFRSFAFESPPHPTDSTVPVYHLLATCSGTCIEDWMGLDIAVCAVGKASIYAVAQKVRHYNQIVFKLYVRLDFFINFEFKISTKKYPCAYFKLNICIKYSMCDLIRDVISCCVWSCDTGKINVSDKILTENH